MSEDDQCNVCNVFERFSGDYKKLITDFVALVCGSVDEMDKLKLLLDDQGGPLCYIGSNL